MGKKKLFPIDWCIQHRKKKTNDKKGRRKDVGAQSKKKMNDKKEKRKEVDANDKKENIYIYIIMKEGRRYDNREKEKLWK